MRRGLLLGGLLIVSSTAIAMDYSHPMAPSNTTECVGYATGIVETVDKFIDDEVDRNKDHSNLSEEFVEKYPEAPESEIEKVEYLELFLKDVMTLYRSARFAYDPETMFFEIRMECEMAVIDNEYEEDMKTLEGLMGN